MNCKNCGAPFHDGKCDYCGTEAQPKIVSRMTMTATGITLECKQIGEIKPEWVKDGRLAGVGAQ